MAIWLNLCTLTFWLKLCGFSIEPTNSQRLRALGLPRTRKTRVLLDFDLDSKWKFGQRPAFPGSWKVKEPGLHLLDGSVDALWALTSCRWLAGWLAVAGCSIAWLLDCLIAWFVGCPFCDFFGAARGTSQVSVHFSVWAACFPLPGLPHQTATSQNSRATEDSSCIQTFSKHSRMPGIEGDRPGWGSRPYRHTLNPAAGI